MRGVGVGRKNIKGGRQKAQRSSCLLARSVINRCVSHTRLRLWALGIRTHVLTFAQKAPSCLSHLPSPSLGSRSRTSGDSQGLSAAGRAGCIFTKPPLASLFRGGGAGCTPVTHMFSFVPAELQLGSQGAERLGNDRPIFSLWPSALSQLLPESQL